MEDGEGEGREGGGGVGGEGATMGGGSGGGGGVEFTPPPPPPQAESDNANTIDPPITSLRSNRGELMTLPTFYAQIVHINTQRFRQS